MESKFVILILKLISADINGNELKTFCILLKHIDSKNECYPSVRTIAKSYNMSPTTVSKCLKSLEAKGIISSINRTINGKTTSNLYRINKNYLISKKRESSKKKIIEEKPEWFENNITTKIPDEQKLENIKKLLDEFK